jgi:hypothetical protein
MTRAQLRLAVAATAGAATLAASPAFAQGAAKIDAADTAWMLGATGLVLMMTIPGLALFYAGMVRKKNVLATMAQCMAATFLVSILWAVIGYSLTFTGDGAYIGKLNRIFLNGMTLDAISPHAKTIPESLFMIYQMTFAVITVALVAGSSPIVCASPHSSCSAYSGCCWSTCRSRIGSGAAASSAATAWSISPAGWWCISMPASPAWSRPMSLANGAATAAKICRPTI